MIRRLSLRQRRLFLSVAMNFVTRVPSIAIIFIFLPAMRRDLGIEGYGQLLTSLAAGNVLSIPFGGFNQMTTRLVGEAHGRHSDADEARAFKSSAVVNAGTFAVLALALWSYTLVAGSSAIVFSLAILPIAQAAINSTVDATRLGYNEQFVTATNVLICQIVIYGAAFVVPGLTGNAFLSALIFNGPILIGSMIGTVMLLGGRPHLLRGPPTYVGEIARKGVSVSVADGLIVSSLNIATVWLGIVGNSVLVAWFASITRIFQMILNPILLLVTPLAAYVRAIWSELDARRRDTLIYVVAVAAVACGAAAVVLIALLNAVYVVPVLRVDPGVGTFALVPILALMGVICAYKGFSSIAYLVLDSHNLIRGTIVIFSTALAVAAAATPFLSPLNVVRLFAVLASIPETALLVWTALQHRQVESPAR